MARLLFQARAHHMGTLYLTELLSALPVVQVQCDQTPRPRPQRLYNPHI
jgi:hypothetical protein